MRQSLTCSHSNLNIDDLTVLENHSKSRICDIESEASYLHYKSKIFQFSRHKSTYLYKLKNLNNLNFPHFFSFLFVCQFAISRIFFYLNKRPKKYGKFKLFNFFSISYNFCALDIFISLRGLTVF